MKHSFAFIFILLILAGIVASCQKDTVTPYDPTAQAATDDALIKEFMAKDTTIKNPVRTNSGLYYIKRIAGNGKQVKAGDKVQAHYIGKFLNGQTFESSYASNSPITFTVGQNQVIKGWDEGLQLMQEGETARFYIPSGLAYGPQGNRTIPGNASLIFDITVIKVN